MSDTDPTDSISSNSKAKKRRKVLKTAGIGLSGLLAGCSGSGGSGGSGGSSGGGTVTKGDSSQDISGVTFEWWDSMNQQSRAAGRTLKKWKQNFENQTGANIKVNWSTPSNADTKWQTEFSRGNRPHICGGSGWMIRNDWNVSATDFQNQIDPEFWDSIQYLEPSVKAINQGYDDTWPLVPWNATPRNGIMARLDKIEEAGLDPEKDFPPKDYKDLIRVASAMQSETDVKHGMHMFGARYDWQDIMQPWALSIGGTGNDGGRFLSKDWSRIVFNNDTWVETVKKAKAVWKEHGLSGPTTPTASDEAMVNLLISGDVGMTMLEWFNHPDLVDRGGKMMTSKDGKQLQWGVFNAGKHEQPGMLNFGNLAIVAKPEKADKEKYERKRNAAIQFLNFYVNESHQVDTNVDFGLFPVRDDVRERAIKLNPGEDVHHQLQTGFKLMDQMDYGWPAHPKHNPIRHRVIPPYIQKMWKDELTPEEAVKKGAEAASKTIEGSKWTK